MKTSKKSYPVFLVVAVALLSLAVGLGVAQKSCEALLVQEYLIGSFRPPMPPKNVQMIAWYLDCAGGLWLSSLMLVGLSLGSAIIGVIRGEKSAVVGSLLVILIVLYTALQMLMV